MCDHAVKSLRPTPTPRSLHLLWAPGEPPRPNQAAGFLRSHLFKRLHIHTVPTLHFQFDRTTERAADMNALIAKAVSSRSKEE